MLHLLKTNKLFLWIFNEKRCTWKSIKLSLYLLFCWLVIGLPNGSYLNSMDRHIIQIPDGMVYTVSLPKSRNSIGISLQFQAESKRYAVICRLFNQEYFSVCREEIYNQKFLGKNVLFIQVEGTEKNPQGIIINGDLKPLDYKFGESGEVIHINLSRAQIDMYYRDVSYYHWLFRFVGLALFGYFIGQLSYCRVYSKKGQNHGNG